MDIMVKRIIYLLGEVKWGHDVPTYHVLWCNVVCENDVMRITGYAKYYCENSRASRYYRKQNFVNKRTAIQALKRRYKKVRKLSTNELAHKKYIGCKGAFGNIDEEIFVA